MRSFGVFVLCVLFCLSVRQVSAEATCDAEEDEEESVMTIESVKSKYGECELIVSKQLDSIIFPMTPDIDVRGDLETGETAAVHVKLVIKGLPVQHKKEKLTFHSKGGKRVVVSNNGTRANKINELAGEGFGGLLTNRPLQRDEVFEVRLDNLISHYETSLGIGITYHNTRNADYNDWMACGTIMLYNHKIYESGTVTKENYGPNLRTLKVGDRVGVVKKRNGDIHFLVNGKDHGVAVSDIHYPVHGVLDLFGNALQVTLL